MKLYRLPVYTLLATLAACATTPPPRDPNAADVIKVARGPVRMPGGVNLDHLQLVNEKRLIRVYTQMVSIGDEANDKLLFPRAVADKVALTNKQVNRRLQDMIQETRRFEVFDDSTTIVRENARQSLNGQMMDIIIDCEVVDAYQEAVDIAPYKKIQTHLRLSVQMKDVESGQQLFPGGASVAVDFGLTQGEGTLLAPNVALGSPDMQTKMANDYKRTLDKGLDAAVKRIGEVMRPVGRVTAADAGTINMLGGTKHGFQSGDNIVVFRAEMGTIGGKQSLVRTQPLAVAHCEGVGDDFTECDLTRIDPRFPAPNKDDYAVLSDDSLNRPRAK